MTARANAGYRSSRITTATTTAVKATGGIVRHVLVEVALTGTATFNDRVGTKLILPIGAAGLYHLDMLFAGKIEVVTSATDRLVVVYD